MAYETSNYFLSFRQRKSLLVAKLDACSDMERLIKIRTGIDELNEWAYDNVIKHSGTENRAIARRMVKEVENLEKEYRKRFDALRRQRIYGVSGA